MVKVKANIVRIKDGVPWVPAQFRGGFVIRVIHPQTTDSKSLSVSMMYLAPGGKMDPHEHKTEEAYIILEGEGEGYFGFEKPIKIEKGMFIHLPSYAEHGLKNTGDQVMTVIVCTSPPSPPKEWPNIPI